MNYNELTDGEFDLTVYVPTKGRPANALRLQERFYKTTKLNSRVVFILSSNDERLHDYKNLLYSTTVTPDKPGFVSPLNLGYLKDRREVYSYALGFMGDDHLPGTVGWDERAVGAIKKLGGGLVYGNDLLQGKRIPTQIFMSSSIPLALGFMTLPCLKHLYADNFWLDLGNAINRITYMEDVIIEHLHPAAGKAHHDKGYEFSGSYLLDQEDKRMYYEYLNHQLLIDATRVSAALRRQIL